MELNKVPKVSVVSFDDLSKTSSPLDSASPHKSDDNMSFQSGSKYTTKLVKKKEKKTTNS